MPKHRLPHWLKRTPGRRALVGVATVALVAGGGGTTAWALTGGKGPQLNAAVDNAQAQQRRQPRADRDQNRTALPKKTTTAQKQKQQKSDDSGKNKDIASTTLKAKKADPESSGGSESSLGGGTCEASNYGQGSMTASGEPFNPSAMTAAHKTLPFGTKLRVTNTANGDSVVVRVNDRGPFVAGRCLDLTTAAFERIASMGAGVATVRYTILSRG